MKWRKGAVKFNTLYLKSIHDPEPGLLKPGSNNKKLGYIVTKGRWKNKRLFSLTLEERSTCPTTCHHWDDCYGNNMPFAKRYRHGEALREAIHHDIKRLLDTFPYGVVIRLHVLGDFYSVPYVAFWGALLGKYPKLAIFGYTAHRPAVGKVQGDDIGESISFLNGKFEDQCVIRFSFDKDYDEISGARFASSEAHQGDTFTCPEQTGQVKSCATCAACWGKYCTKTVKFLSH